MKPITISLFVFVISFLLGSCQPDTHIAPRFSGSSSSRTEGIRTQVLAEDTPTIVYRDSPDLTPEEALFFKTHPEISTLHRYPYGTKIYFSPIRDIPMPRGLSMLFRTGVICPNTKNSLSKGIGGGILVGGCMTLEEYAQQIETYFEEAGYGDVLVNIYISQELNTLTIHVYNAQMGQTPGGLIATIITALFS